MITCTPLLDPTPEIAATLERWDNDPVLVPYIRHCPTREASTVWRPVTVESLRSRLETVHLYLIWVDGRLVGEMSYEVDPPHCYRAVAGTAWIGISLGESEARGRGIGRAAMAFLEEEIRRIGLTRIELGVFEFNTGAMHLYRKLGYVEIGRIDAFTWRADRMWQDIRMEKMLGEPSAGAP